MYTSVAREDSAGHDVSVVSNVGDCTSSRPGTPTKPAQSEVGGTGTEDEPVRQKQFHISVADKNTNQMSFCQMKGC